MNRGRLITLFVAICAALLASAQPAGRLCLEGNECSDFLCGNEVHPAPHARPFTFSSPDGYSVYFGTLEPHGSRIVCSDYATLDLRLAAPTLGRQNNVRMSFAQDPGRTWTIDRNAGRMTSPLLIHVAPGRYDVTIEAAHFVRFRKRIDVTKSGTRLTAALQPLPRFAGRVIDRKTRDAIPGALVSTEVDTDAISDSNGRFVLDADPEAWPKTIRVSAGGYAGTEVAVPTARASSSFDEIALSRGGTIAVDLEQSEPDQVVALDLQRTHEDGRRLGATIRTIAVTGSDQRAVLKIDGVEPGEYVVLARGSKEWERLAEPVVVREQEEVPLGLRITPFRLRLRTVIDGEPLPESGVRLRQRDLHWEALVALGDAGAAHINLWQGGRLNATVEAAGRVPFIERRTIPDGVDAEWLLEIPTRRITGTVVDARTGAPVGAAAVSLSMRSVDGYHLSVKTTADADGTFAFSPVTYGLHTVKAAAADYPPGELEYTFLEPQQSREVTLQLDRGSTAELRVTDPRGAPLQGVMVLDFLGLTRGGRSYTDSNGVARIMLKKNEIRDVYLIPRDGSLGFVQVKAGSGKTAVVIADGVSRIVLRTESEARAPIPNISVVIRHDGHVLPIEVIDALRTAGSRVKSDADGRIVLNHMPVGVYEFWPVGSVAELRALAAGVGAEAAVRLRAVPGENVAVMTFANVKK